MFIEKEKKSLGIIKYLLFLIGILALFVFAVEGYNKGGEDDSKKLLLDVVNKTAIHCYAIEGQYPENIEYLEKNYGLKYNKDRFTIHYELIGSNILPNIFITESDTNG